MTQTWAPTGVVVGDDGSAGAAAAVRYAVEEAQRRGCTLHLVRAYTLLSSSRPADLPFGVVPSDEELTSAAEAELAARWGDLATASGVEVDIHPVHGRADEELIAASRTACVVVVGARGVGGIEALLLGSVADRVVAHADCPVVVVRG